MFAGSTPIFYRRLASPLHATRPSVGALWATALTAAILVLFHPLVLLALLVAVLIAGAAAGVRSPMSRSLRTAAIVSVPIVAINVLVARNGLTVFARLGDLGPFGQADLTVEALVYGAVIALKVVLVILVTTLASLTVDPDELLRGMRRLSFRSALTASLAVRMIPLLAADAQRVAEAQRTRPGGAPASPRARVALLRAVVGGSLDRAMDVAATLELRGFAMAGRPATAPTRTGRRGARRLGARRLAGWPAPGLARRRRPWSRHDIAFICSASAALALALLGVLGGVAPFDAYPLVRAPVSAATLALCAALVLAVLAPFCDRRGVEL